MQLYIDNEYFQPDFLQEVKNFLNNKIFQDNQIFYAVSQIYAGGGQETVL